MGTNRSRAATTARSDVYEEVTSQIVALLEAGARPWSPRWASGAASLPLRHEGTAYRGINILLLWSAAMTRGYINPHWMTYRQAAELGGQVRKGEKGNLVVHAGTFIPKDGETGEPITNAEGEETTRNFLKKYIVFNVEQIDGLDMGKFPAPQTEIRNRDARDSELDAAFARWPVPYREGGNSAYYDPSADRIQMPAFADFVTGNAFYATLAHEAVHNAAIRIMPHGLCWRADGPALAMQLFGIIRALPGTRGVGRQAGTGLTEWLGWRRERAPFPSSACRRGCRFGSSRRSRDQARARSPLDRRRGGAGPSQCCGEAYAA
jgi:hypothetical protein